MVDRFRPDVALWHRRRGGRFGTTWRALVQLVRRPLRQELRTIPPERDHNPRSSGREGRHHDRGLQPGVRVEQRQKRQAGRLRQSSSAPGRCCHGHSDHRSLLPDLPREVCVTRPRWRGPAARWVATTQGVGGLVSSPDGSKSNFGWGTCDEIPGAVMARRSDQDSDRPRSSRQGPPPEGQS